MIKSISIIILCFFSFSGAYATGDTTGTKKEEMRYENLWVNKKTLGLNISEMAFVNWTSGGNNSITTLASAEVLNKYKDAYYSWTNKLGFRYGMSAQEGRELWKTEDELAMSSTFGYRSDSLSNWYYSAKIQFNTQFSHGYRQPHSETPISEFMAPGYTFIGVGSEYSSPDDVWNLYISPVTEKSTFVLDQKLANQGMFGVTPAIRDEEGNIIEEGENIRSEFGFLFTGNFSKQIFENVNLQNTWSLYSDYLNKFGNVDVDWQMELNLIVNKYVKANIGAHLRYDDDVKFKKDINNDGSLEVLGPRLQFKQLLGVGMVYTF